MSRFSSAIDGPVSRFAINGQVTPALALRGLTKRYDDGTLALDALDLEVPAGSGRLTGRNGLREHAATRVGSSGD
jgi:hypothetical protein